MAWMPLLMLAPCWQEWTSGRMHVDVYRLHHAH